MFSLQEILRHAVRDNRPDNRRRQQLRAILQKYCNLSANKEELAAHMKKRSLVSALCSSVRRTHHMVTSAQGGLSVAGRCRCLTKDSNTSIEKEGYIPYSLQA